MIKLRDAFPSDSLPEIVKKQPWAAALCYAIGKMIHRLLDIADATRSFCRVNDITRHDILDALAIDLKVTQYDTSYTLEVKRKLIIFALQYWATAGTLSATQEVVDKVLGDGKIIEWYEYGGTPGCFRIQITDNTLTDAEILKFKDVAENVKRLSAWLDKVVLDMENDPQIQRVGFIEHNATNTSVKQQRDPNQFYGFALHEMTKTIITQEE